MLQASNTAASSNVSRHVTFAEMATVITGRALVPSFLPYIVNDQYGPELCTSDDAMVAPAAMTGDCAGGVGGAVDDPCVLAPLSSPCAGADAGEEELPLVQIDYDSMPAGFAGHCGIVMDSECVLAPLSSPCAGAGVGGGEPLLVRIGVDSIPAGSAGHAS